LSFIVFWSSDAAVVHEGVAAPDDHPAGSTPVRDPSFRPNIEAQEVDPAGEVAEEPPDSAQPSDEEETVVATVAPVLREEMGPAVVEAVEDSEVAELTRDPTPDEVSKAPRPQSHPTSGPTKPTKPMEARRPQSHPPSLSMEVPVKSSVSPITQPQTSPRPETPQRDILPIINPTSPSALSPPPAPLGDNEALAPSSKPPSLPPPRVSPGPAPLQKPVPSDHHAFKVSWVADVVVIVPLGGMATSWCDCCPCRKSSVSRNSMKQKLSVFRDFCMNVRTIVLFWRGR